MATDPHEADASSTLQFVAVTTPSGARKMTLAPFSDESSVQAKSKKKPRPKKRRADQVESSSNSSSSSSSNPSPSTTSKATDDDSWSKNLQRRGGFWGDAYWYDLQLETRLPLAKTMLQQLVRSLPPCGDKAVLDLCAGSGRASAAVLEAYPTVQLVLVDSSEQRLAMARQRLEDVQKGVKHRTQFITKTIEASSDTTQLYSESMDLVIACLAFHVLVEKPAHYAQDESSEEGLMTADEKYEKIFQATWRALRPGGHVVFADHVGQLGLFKQLKILEKVGFEDVDCAWRQDDSFVAGGRKPLA